MQTVKTASTAKGSSDMTAAKSLNGTCTDNATFENALWCTWCDRPRNDCACHLDPNGIPEGHWSKPAPLAFGCGIIDPRCATDPQAVADEYQKRKLSAGFEIRVNIHNHDASRVLSDPSMVRELVGMAIDTLGLEEEIDYTLEVHSTYRTRSTGPGPTGGAA